MYALAELSQNHSSLDKRIWNSINNDETDSGSSRGWKLSFVGRVIAAVSLKVSIMDHKNALVAIWEIASFT